MTTPAALLQARDIAKSFGQTPALRGASLAVARGEIVAVMGPSGSGKSTLLHCLAGIFPPDSGEVWFDGRRLDTLTDSGRTRLRRTAFGFVFQFGNLVPELTAADNVALPLVLKRAGRKEAYRQAARWLDRLGLGGKGTQRTGELPARPRPGGELQRGLLPGADDRAARRRRPRAGCADAARHLPASRTRRVLRFAGPGAPAGHSPGRPARRPVRRCRCSPTSPPSPASASSSQPAGPRVIISASYRSM